MFYLVRAEEMERRVIAGDSRAAVEVAEGSQGRVVQQEGLLGILPVLESPGRACSTVRKDKGCNP